MKDTAYRIKCIDRVLSQHSGLDVMLGLADIAYDIFLISLRQENKKLTATQTRQIIKELSKWKEAWRNKNQSTTNCKKCYTKESRRRCK